MSKLSFLSASAWLDDDGLHVWSLHRCFNEEWQLTMLPYPTWRCRDGIVMPSIQCACGYHDTPPVWPPNELLEKLSVARGNPEFQQRLAGVKARKEEQRLRSEKQRRNGEL